MILGLLSIYRLKTNAFIKIKRNRYIEKLILHVHVTHILPPSMFLLKLMLYLLLNVP